MNAAVDVLETGPPAELRFRFRLRILSRMVELYRARELVWTLAEREMRARYKQALLGFAWALITPVALMLVFSTFLRRVVDPQTAGAPYQLFSYLGLLPWTFFSTSVSVGGQALLNNKLLLNKVYCPREVFPFASIGVATIDTVIALVPLAVLFAMNGFAPRIESLWIPVILLVQVAFTVGVTLIVSCSVVYLRDVRHGLPLILQLGLFATPVAYGMEAVPRAYHTLYAALNPLAGVIESYRRTVLHGLAPAWNLLIPGAITATVLMLVGYAYFKRLEWGFADVA